MSSNSWTWCMQMPRIQLNAFPISEVARKATASGQPDHIWLMNEVTITLSLGYANHQVKKTWNWILVSNVYTSVLVPPREQLFSLRHTDETAATKYLVREETTHTLILPSKGDKGTNTYHSMHTHARAWPCHYPPWGTTIWFFLYFGISAQVWRFKAAPWA